MNTKVSKYKFGWIGIRVERFGRAWPRLKKRNWIRTHSAQLNNRNGFDCVLPMQSYDAFKAYDFTKETEAGLIGLAFWITDAQWGKNAGITDKQWIERRIID